MRAHTHARTQRCTLADRALSIVAQAGGGGACGVVRGSTALYTSGDSDGHADGNTDAKRARTEAALPVSQRVSTANDWEQADGEDDELLAEMLRVAEAAEAAALGRRYDSVVAVADGVGGAGGGCDVGGVGDGRRETDEHSDDEWLGEG